MNKFWLGLVLCVAFTVGQFAAAELELRTNHPGTYTVKTGDTLWDISEMYLKTPWLWPEIWQANPQVSNPHLIYPGDILSLIYLDGKPRLVVNRGSVKLSPQMRTSPLGAAIPAIPLDAISSFLSRSRVVDKETLSGAPYVLAVSGSRIISAAGDKIYARGEFDPSTKFYGIYREGETFIDPETREKLGIQALEIGTGRIVAEDEEEGVTSILLNSSNEEVNSIFYPKAPDDEVEGVIIAVEGGVASIGRYDVVAINRGEREGLATGDVLAVNQAGKTIRDSVGKGRVKLPSERAGLLIVFKVFEKLSYGLILEAERPLSVFDEVTNP